MRERDPLTTVDAMSKDFPLEYLRAIAQALVDPDTRPGNLPEIMAKLDEKTRELRKRPHTDAHTDAQIGRLHHFFDSLVEFEGEKLEKP